jgi:hypothetical protein
MSLALGYIEKTAATLDANSLKQFIRLSLTIIESAQYYLDLAQLP